MKGPGFRLDLDVRRVWECPACGRRQKTAGHVTRLDCDCRPERPFLMRLVEGRRRTESPFDHVGYAAMKRIDAALHPTQGPPEPPRDREPSPEPLVDSAPPVDPTATGEAVPGEPTGPPSG